MKAVIYARFSPRRRPSKAESIDTQLDRCRSYCMANDYTLVAERSDEMLSGARTGNRPGLESAIAAACRHKAVLVVYALSRLARNTKDAIEIADRLAAGGAHLAMLDMQIDTSSSIGRCFFTILAALDQLERERIAERTSDAMLRLQADGRRMSKQPPYGWMIDPDSPRDADSGRRTGLIANPREQAVIPRIVELHGRGMSLRAIGRQLAREGISCRGNGFHHSRIKAILLRAGSFACHSGCAGEPRPALGCAAT